MFNDNMKTIDESPLPYAMVVEIDNDVDSQKYVCQWSRLLRSLEDINYQFFNLPMEKSNAI
jgi:hypothetical protein